MFKLCVCIDNNEGHEASMAKHTYNLNFRGEGGRMASLWPAWFKVSIRSLHHTAAPAEFKIRPGTAIKQLPSLALQARSTTLDFFSLFPY